MPFFGDLHIHTRFSADAYIFGTRVGPRDAYDFARGGTLAVVDENEAPTRSARLDRPLDFAAVTDHAEFFGEVRLCDTPTSGVYDEHLCQILRAVDSGVDRENATIQWLFPAGIPNPPREHAFCALPGIDCDAGAVSVWQEMQAAAEAAYDRTAACTFTSFLGYEYTPSPIGRHLHRNVVFRNAVVPPIALSLLDTVDGGIPQGLWSAIEAQCLHAGSGCDALIIPHNSNLSGGMQFEDPADGTEALRRQTLEPLVEIHQVKGSSECRFDRLAGAGTGTSDELCAFEQMPLDHQGPDATALPVDQYPPRNLVRNTLKDGLALEQLLGANPFRLGFVGGTDTHNGTGGTVAEADWPGAQGDNDAPAIRLAQELHSNPGAYTVAWAEENSRDAIFAALRRRETYATSGTRPVVRFFAGELADTVCGNPDFIQSGYATGTPMGGEIGPPAGRQVPRFAVWAVKDPGTGARPGTNLERIQIVKGWVDAGGTTHERVTDVAGAAVPTEVDPTTCASSAPGHGELCAVWEDPEFDPAQRAFYYARVLELPTCRWSTLECRAGGVDPLSADCAAQAAAAGPAFAGCCRGPSNDPFIEPVLRERAWTSPIWYRPDGIARVRGQLRFGARPGRDTLAVKMWLGAAAGIDPGTTDLELHVSDEADIVRIHVPAGTLRRAGARRWVLRNPTGALAGVRKLVFAVRKAGDGVVVLRMKPADLARVDRAEHAVDVGFSAGLRRAAHGRLWSPRRNRLLVGEPG